MNYIITTSEGEALYHYGILGQKWGVRRYQNPDGTLTEAGKKRYGSVENYEAVKNTRNKKIKMGAAGAATAAGATAAIVGSKKILGKNKDSKNYTDEEIQKMKDDNLKQAIANQYKKNHKGQSKAEKAGSAITASKDVVRTMKELNNKFAEKSSKEDLSKFSDAELQRIVNRMNLEQRYYQLNPQQIDDGAKQIDKILDVANGLLTVTGTAVALYAALKK